MAPPKRIRQVKTEEEKKAEEAEAKKKSFGAMTAYAKREPCLFFLGMFCLFFGQLSDLAIPAFIGLVINLLVEEKYHEIYMFCYKMLALVCVS